MYCNGLEGYKNVTMVYKGLNFLRLVEEFAQKDVTFRKKGESTRICFPSLECLGREGGRLAAARFTAFIVKGRNTFCL